MLKRTALFSAHQKLGAKLIDFGGWEMPVYYTSITDEHLAVRNAAGIFDISHMGEITLSGAAAAEFLNQLLTNDINKLSPGLGQYTLMCNERGGVIDDLYAYRLCGDVYFLVINASRIEADVAWIQSQVAKFPRRSELILTDASHNYAAVAVQGPRAMDFINDVIPGASISAMRVAHVTDLKKIEIGGFKFENQSVLVSRTGYTGEDGFEIVGNDESIQHLWNKIISLGRSFGLKPCGLGARDTLRTEAGEAVRPGSFRCGGGPRTASASGRRRFWRAASEPDDDWHPVFRAGAAGRALRPLPARGDRAPDRLGRRHVFEVTLRRRSRI